MWDCVPNPAASKGFVGRLLLLASQVYGSSLWPEPGTTTEGVFKAKPKAQPKVKQEAIDITEWDDQSMLEITSEEELVEEPILKTSGRMRGHT